MLILIMWFKEFQVRRHTFGPLLKFHIFTDAGSIYISDACEPSSKHLKQLVRACGGRCTSSETMAKVVVGYTCRMRNNINEKWILDCITQGTLLNKNQYILVNNTIAKQNWRTNLYCLHLTNNFLYSVLTSEN